MSKQVYICTPVSSAVTNDKYGEFPRPKPGSTDDPDDHPIAPWPEPGPWRKENAELHAKVAELEAALALASERNAELATSLARLIQAKLP